MRKNSSLLIVSEDNLITKIIKSLKSFLIRKQDKEEVSNRTAVVLTEEKIERKCKKSITYDDLSRMEEKSLQDITYIDDLDEEELNSLDEYYDMRLNELENVLNDKKSRYYKLISTKRV